MKKKFLAMIMCAAMTVGILTGCGNSATDAVEAGAGAAADAVEAGADAAAEAVEAGADAAVEAGADAAQAGADAVEAGADAVADAAQAGADAVADAAESAVGEKVKVRIGTQEMPNDEGIAKALGYFQEEMGENVEIEIINFDSGKDVNTALASDSIDIGLIGNCPATIAIAQDFGVEMIWIHEVLGPVESLVARADSGITKVEDLKGKNVAVPFASTAHFSLLKALESAGIAETDLTIYDMSSDKIYASWVNGDIDAAYIWQPTLAELEDQVVVCTSEDMAKAGFMTSNCEVVKKDFAAAHPEVVEAYIRALDKAAKLFKEDQTTAVKAIADSMELTEEDALFQMNGSTWLTAEEQLSADYFGTSDAKGALVKNLYDTAQFLVDQNSIPELPEESVFESAVNPQYIEAALQ